MAKMPNQKLKLLYLMKILLARTDAEHAMTLAEISAELAGYDISAERKSLYDDLELLKVYGIDVQVKRDRQVRYYVAKHPFSLAELKLLIDAVQASKSITVPKSMELIRKLEGLGSHYEGTLLQEQVFMEHRLKAANEEIFANVERVYLAISRNRKIEFRYFEWNARKQRLLRHEGRAYWISPWALAWHDENYYLVAYDSEAESIKHFRVDKMLEVSILEERREGERAFADFDMAIYSRRVFGMYGGESCNVRIRCDNELAGVVIDRFGQDVTVLTNTDTYFEFSAKVMVSPTFFAWVLGFGGKMKILSPESVAQSLVSMAREALAAYENETK